MGLYTSLTLGRRVVFDLLTVAACTEAKVIQSIL